MDIKNITNEVDKSSDEKSKERMHFSHNIIYFELKESSVILNLLKLIEALKMPIK